MVKWNLTYAMTAPVSWDVQNYVVTIHRHGSSDAGNFYAKFQFGTSQFFCVLKRWPRCLPWSAWGTHDSTNFVNWARDSFTVTLVSDMEIVFGALVSLKSAIRWFCLEDKPGQTSTMRPCMPALRMSVYVWCCRAGLSRSWPPYWRRHSPIGANLQNVSIKLHGVIRESQ